MKNNMTKQIYVKLLAKPNTWFKEGTEVYSYDSNPPENLLRVTKEEWEGGDSILTRGICVEDGEWDGEFCSKEEFEFLGYVED